MLRNSSVKANPIIVAAVENLFDEDRQFERTERRFSIREQFSRPVTVKLNDKDEVYDVFSKNISFEGIGIISKNEFPQGAEAKIEIYSSNSVNPVIVSKLAWCKPFGKGWYISGWRFVTAVRG